MSLDEQVAEILSLLKQNQPTERDRLQKLLDEARKRKDFSEVISLSNQLNTLED